MFREMYLIPSRLEKLRARCYGAEPMNAVVRRTARGVRIRFSDGRLAWLDKDAGVSEDLFMGSVQQWVNRHGAGTITFESD